MGNVLVVEDDLAAAGVLKLCLELAGYSVHAVREIAEAEEALDAHRYEAVVLDLALTDGTGYDLLRHVRQDRRSSVPVIIVSGMRQRDSILRALALGADDYLRKPFSPRELVARVDRLTGRTRADLART